MCYANCRDDVRCYENWMLASCQLVDINCCLSIDFVFSEQKYQMWYENNNDKKK